MLRMLCLTGFILIGGHIFSQNTKTVKTTSQKPATPNPVVPKILKDLRDSASYTAGIHLVNKYRSQNIYNFNSAVCARAVDDLQKGKQQLINDNAANDIIQKYQEVLMNGTNSNPQKTVPDSRLNDLRDSASYVAGIHLVKSLRDFDLFNFNSVIILRAINDLQSQKKPLLNDTLANAVALRYQYKLQEIKNKSTIDAGKKFLGENKKRPGVKVTKSGLQYQIITQGNGPKPTRKDKVSCNYIGSFIDGNEFENSYRSGQPVTFGVSQVIPGWTEALQMMPVGSKWKLYIPYNLAYGPGQYNTIPGGSVLIFEIELVGIVSN